MKSIEFLKNEEGSFMVESAIIMPFILITIFGMMLIVIVSYHINLEETVSLQKTCNNIENTLIEDDIGTQEEEDLVNKNENLELVKTYNFYDQLSDRIQITANLKEQYKELLDRILEQLGSD